MHNIKMVYNMSNNMYEDKEGTYMLRLKTVPSNTRRLDTRWELLRLGDNSVLDYDEHVGQLAEAWGMELVLDDI